MRHPVTPAAILLVFVLAGCGGDAMMPSSAGGTTKPTDMKADPVTDAQVFQLARADSSWVFYRFSEDTLDSAGNSVHTGRIRARYNTLAQASLDAAGRVDPAKTFPDGSMIAKEIYQDGRLVSLAVMYKRLSDPNAGHGGWLWAEYGPGGYPLHSVAADGRVCHDCHVVGADHTRMNDTHF